MYSEPGVPFPPPHCLSTSGTHSITKTNNVHNTLEITNNGARVVHQPQPILLRLSPFTHLFVPIELTPIPIQSSESTTLSLPLQLPLPENLDCGLDRPIATSTPIPIPPMARERKVTFGEPVFRRPTEDELVYIRGLSSPQLRAVEDDHKEKVFSLMPLIAVLQQPQPHSMSKDTNNDEEDQTTDLNENEKEGGLSGWEGDDECESDYDSDGVALDDDDDTRVSLPPRWFARAASGTNRPRRYTMDLSF